MKKIIAASVIFTLLFSTGIAASEEYSLGDVNCDGKITTVDCNYLMKKAQNNNFKLPIEEIYQSDYFDMDCDGNITLEDVKLLLNIVRKVDSAIPINEQAYISANDLDIGVYTSDITRGNPVNGFVTIKASAEDPVIVKEIDAYKYNSFSLEGNRIVSGDTEKVKAIIIGENNKITINTKSAGFKKGKTYYMSNDNVVYTIYSEQYATDNNYKDNFRYIVNDSTGEQPYHPLGSTMPDEKCAYLLSKWDYFGFNTNSKYTIETNPNAQYALIDVAYKCKNKYLNYTESN